MYATTLFGKTIEEIAIHDDDSLKASQLNKNTPIVLKRTLECTLEVEWKDEEMKKDVEKLH